MRFIVDTQLPPRLAKWLTAKGHETIHTTNYSEGHLLKDAEIISIAIESERTVITKDSDFSEHFLLRGAPPKVLLLEFGNIELVQLFELYFKEVMAAFEEGNELVIFRREEVIGY
ncbi:MAG: DUF5615 family PIN-like protein [Bacteroidia bacterium]